MKQIPATQVPSAVPRATPPPRAPRPDLSEPPRRIKPKLGHNILDCFTLALAVFLLVCVSGLYFVAKSGVVELPFFSRVYQGPSPTRLVYAKRQTLDEIKQDMAARLAQQMAAKKYPPYTLRLTEQELSGFLQQGLDTAFANTDWKESAAQLAIRQNDLEVSGELHYGIFKFDLLIRFVPQLHPEGVTFAPVAFQLGDYALPPATAYRLLGYLFSRDLGAWQLSYGDMRPDAISLHDGYLTLDITPVE